MTARAHLATGDVANAVWPSGNEWGVPTLDLALQADVVDAPFARWGRERRKSRMRGTWHFYTDDYRFERLWLRPQDLVNSACVATVEPNFSVSAATPPARALWQVFRKRTLARIWQHHGVRVIVDLAVDATHAELNLLGVPRGWASWATRGSGITPDDLTRELDRAAEHAGAQPKLFAVYGGSRRVRALCERNGWLWRPEEADVVRGRAAPHE